MKYRFVKRRQEISTEEIKSMQDFGSVLKGSRRLLDIAYKGKLLWTLTIPVAIVVYTFVIDQSPVNDTQELDSNQPVQEEVLSTPPQEEDPEQIPPREELRSISEQDKTEAVDSNPQQKKDEQPVEKLDLPAKNTAEPEVVKEDIYIKATPKTGYEAFYAFIDEELTYPELARKDSTQGHVKVLFSFDKGGKVGDIVVLESLGDLFDNEAIRVIKRIPPWNPATLNGEPIPSRRMSITLTFKIQ